MRKWDILKRIRAWDLERRRGWIGNRLKTSIKYP
jgi:hypothetical protein